MEERPETAFTSKRIASVAFPCIILVVAGGSSSTLRSQASVSHRLEKNWDVGRR